VNWHDPYVSSEDEKHPRPYVCDTCAYESRQTPDAAHAALAERALVACVEFEAAFALRHKTVVGHDAAKLCELAVTIAAELAALEEK
jgi:hypothetical protein